MDSLTSSDLGDIAVVKTIADLTVRGYKVFVPLSGHIPVDLVAMNRFGRLARVQVKYARDTGTAGRVQVRLDKSSVKRSKVVYGVTHDRSKFDGFDAYSKATGKVYYVASSMVPKNAKQMFSFRCNGKPSRCNRPVRYAKNFCDPKVLF